MRSIFIKIFMQQSNGTETFMNALFIAYSVNRWHRNRLKKR